MLFIGGHYDGQELEVNPSATQCRMPISLEPETRPLDGSASPIRRYREEHYVRKTIFFRGDYYDCMVVDGMPNAQTEALFMEHLDRDLALAYRFCLKNNIVII